MSTNEAGPLAGIKVLDIGTMIAGPVAATLLADFGAEVIKVEQPQGGDPLRRLGPAVDGEGLYWNVEARNKKSITLDLRLPEGQDILRRLAGQADVLVENFRPGTLDRWNIGYEQLKAENPRLVMLSISGYGQTGPNAERAAYDRIALAFSGFLHVTGYPDRPPVRPGTAMADYQSAILGAFSVMLALYHRDARGGTGQHIDASLYESIFRFTDILVTAYDKLGINRSRRGNMHYAAAPGDHFETVDGRFLVLTVSSDPMFRRLCEAMGSPLHEDPRFTSHAARWDNIETLNRTVGKWIKSMPVSEICARLDAHGLAYSLIYSAEEISADSHYAARESIVTVDNPRIGPLKVQAPHPKLSGTPAPSLRSAPGLGEDTDTILSQWLGLAGHEIASLRAGGVV
jgi:formyl-CoA transferase